jgi:hypothetical protein
MSVIDFFGASIWSPKFRRQRKRPAEQADYQYRGERCYDRHAGI